MPQKTAEEVKNELIDIYNDEDQIRDKSGPFLLTSSGFKTIGDRDNHRSAFSQQVKTLMEEDGYSLLDMHKSKEILGVFRIQSLERKLDILDEYDLGLL